MDDKLKVNARANHNVGDLVQREHHLQLGEIWVGCRKLQYLWNGAIKTNVTMTD